MNVRADQLNALFAQTLKTFEYDGSKKGQLKKVLLEKFKTKFAVSLEESKVLKKKLTEKQGQLDTVEEKFVLGQITQELYDNSH